MLEIAGSPKAIPHQRPPSNHHIPPHLLPSHLIPLLSPFPLLLIPSALLSLPHNQQGRKEGSEGVREQARTEGKQARKKMASLPTIPSTTLPKPLCKPRLPSPKLLCKPTTMISCSSTSSDSSDNSNPMKAFSAALALSSILLSSPAVPPAAADIAGLTPCKESKAFAKREKQSIKKLESALKGYAPDSAPALAIQATIEKTKKRFDNYGNKGLLCGSDGLPHLIVSGDQRHWGEFITPGLLFLYIAGWIGWVGRSYLIAIRGAKKPAMKEIIIDVPLATSLLGRGFIWPVAAYREFLNGELVVDDADVSVTGP